jgi:hypothetical protein
MVSTSASSEKRPVVALPPSALDIGDLLVEHIGQQSGVADVPMEPSS